MNENSMNIPAFTLPNGIYFSGGTVDTKIVQLGEYKPLAELSGDSISLANESAFYYVGVCREYGISTGLPENIETSAHGFYRMIHSNIGKGNAVCDAVYYDEDVRSLPGTRLPDGYNLLKWVKRPKWAIKSEIWMPEEADGSEIVYAEMPPNGWGPVPTMHGYRDLRTGWVFETRPTKEEAIELLGKDFGKYMNSEKALQAAKNEVSYNFRRNKGDGKAAVFRNSSSDVGPFCADASWEGGSMA